MEGMIREENLRRLTEGENITEVRREENLKRTTDEENIEGKTENEDTGESPTINRNEPFKKGMFKVIIIVICISNIFISGSRLRWSAIQKTIMRKYFNKQIKSKKALRKTECEIFINAYKIDFDGVGWVRVKTFVFNESRNT